MRDARTAGEVSITARISTGDITSLIGQDRQIFVEDVVGDLARFYGLVVFNACQDYYSITNDRNIKMVAREELMDEYIERFRTYDISEALRLANSNLDIEHAKAIFAVTAVELMRQTYTATTYLIDDLKEDFDRVFGGLLIPQLQVVEMYKDQGSETNMFSYDIVVTVVASPVGRGNVYPDNSHELPDY